MSSKFVVEAFPISNAREEESKRNRFLIKPEELHGWLAADGLILLDETGVAYSPFAGEWRRSRDQDVNYMLVAQKPA